MKRRNFLKSTFIGSSLLTTTSILSSAKNFKSNFILFYTDDQGWDDTSVRMMDNEPGSHSTFYQTPHLERLAKEGIKFSHGYSPAPTCTPSRISIQYGKTNAKLKITTVHDILAKSRGIRCDGELSIPMMIKQGDPSYITAHFGKGMAVRRMDATGYDVHDEFDPGPNGNYHGDYISNKDKKKKLPADDPKRIYSITKRSVEFLEKTVKENKPFFLMISHYAAHTQKACLKETEEKYKKLIETKHKGDNEYSNPELPIYAGMIENLDWGLGQILNTVDKLGIKENTYIIFTSDNGGAFRGNKPLRGAKGHLWEGGLRVPTVVRGPGILKNTQCDVPVIQWDILPTIHDLMGSGKPLPKGVDGGSWRPVLTKGNKEDVKRPIPGLIFHYPYYTAAPVQSIRIGEYKFMRQLNTGETRLYNVVKDISEEKNLIKEQPDRAKQMDKIMLQYLKEVDAEKLEDVYAARFKELEDAKQKAIEHLEKAKKKLEDSTDPKEKAKHQEKIKKHEDSIKKAQKNIEKCKKQTTHTEWQ